MQQALADLGRGYDLGHSGPAQDGVDGVYGPKTSAVVRQFKRDEALGFTQYGDVGPGTIHRLDALFLRAPVLPEFPLPSSILTTFDSPAKPQAPLPPAASQAKTPAVTEPKDVARDEADAEEVHRLLFEPDPIAGMRTREAIDKLDGLEMSRMISVLRTLRTSHPTDWPILEGEMRPLRVTVAMDIATSQTGTALLPEQLADLRARVPRLSALDQAVAFAALPAVAVPADPTVPAGLVTPAGLPTIPGPLLRTLYLSYARRQAGIPGSQHYLDNAFWGARPADFDAALRTLHPGALDIIIRVYNRWAATSVPWSFCHAIANTWGGTSEGFNFDCRDRSGLEAALKHSPSFCQDTVGGLYHWWQEGSTPCWREIISGSPGLHFCTGNGTSVHIDKHQVVSGTWPGGFCSYDITGSVSDHFRDLGWL